MSPDEKRLVEICESLDAAARHTLLDFAEFLIAKHGGVSSNGLARAAAELAPEPIPPPNAIPRPEVETVVAALKRLSATYPMLSKQKLFDKTSKLVSAHFMQGRDVVDVINELESIFETQYRELTGDDD
jgi:16S rRNA A1518/A1519 N6-dimethyltransferase RsmA/KsgA/DIM1 with predicted DNA glycosylase/AP lyase activity